MELSLRADEEYEVLVLVDIWMFLYLSSIILGYIVELESGPCPEIFKTYCFFQLKVLATLVSESAVKNEGVPLSHISAATVVIVSSPRHWVL